MIPEVINIGIADIPTVSISIATFSTKAIDPPIKAMNNAETIPAMAIFTIHL